MELQIQLLNGSVQIEFGKIQAALIIIQISDHFSFEGTASYLPMVSTKFYYISIEKNPNPMKYIITILLILLASSQAFSQKKGKVDPKDLKIDSLSKASAAQSIQVDSISKALEKYYGVYTALTEKVFKYNFDPAKTSFLIDSLRTTRDSTFNQLSSTSAFLKDSLSVLTKENVRLQATLDSLGLGNDPAKALAKQEADKNKAVADLKQLKELLDAKIITQEEFDTKKKKLLEKL